MCLKFILKQLSSIITHWFPGTQPQKFWSHCPSLSPGHRDFWKLPSDSNLENQFLLDLKLFLSLRFQYLGLHSSKIPTYVGLGCWEVSQICGVLASPGEVDCLMQSATRPQFLLPWEGRALPLGLPTLPPIAELLHLAPSLTNFNDPVNMWPWHPCSENFRTRLRLKMCL